MLLGALALGLIRRTGETVDESDNEVKEKGLFDGCFPSKPALLSLSNSRTRAGGARRQKSRRRFVSPTQFLAFSCSLDSPDKRKSRRLRKTSVARKDQ